MRVPTTSELFFSLFDNGRTVLTTRAVLTVGNQLWSPGSLSFSVGLLAEKLSRKGLARVMRKPEGGRGSNNAGSAASASFDRSAHAQEHCYLVDGLRFISLLRTASAALAVILPRTVPSSSSSSSSASAQSAAAAGGEDTEDLLAASGTKRRRVAAGAAEGRAAWLLVEAVTGMTKHIHLRRKLLRSQPLTGTTGGGAGAATSPGGAGGGVDDLGPALRDLATFVLESFGDVAFGSGGGLEALKNACGMLHNNVSPISPWVPAYRSGCLPSMS